MRTILNLSLLLSLALSLTACGSDKKPGDSIDGGDEDGSTPGPKSSDTFGPEGGEFTTESGLTLRVGSGAVTEDTEFSVTEVTENRSKRTLLDADGSEIGEETPLGNTSFELAPDDVTFESAVFVSAPMEADEKDSVGELFVMTRQGAGDAEPMAVGFATTDYEVLQAVVLHFSTYRLNRVKVTAEVCEGTTLSCNSKGCMLKVGQEQILQTLTRAIKTGSPTRISAKDISGNNYWFTAAPKGKPNAKEYVERMIAAIGCERLKAQLTE